MQNMNYILNGKEVVPCVDLGAWCKWMGTADKQVSRKTINDCTISTVFLGLNHTFGEGPPLLFETLVFGGKLADEIDRYSTWDEAVAGHKKMVSKVKNALPNNFLKSLINWFNRVCDKR